MVGDDETLFAKKRCIPPRATTPCTFSRYVKKIPSDRPTCNGAATTSHHRKRGLPPLYASPMRFTRPLRRTPSPPPFHEQAIFIDPRPRICNATSLLQLRLLTISPSHTNPFSYTYMRLPFARSHFKCNSACSPSLFLSLNLFPGSINSFYKSKTEAKIMLEDDEGPSKRHYASSLPDLVSGLELSRLQET